MSADRYGFPLAVAPQQVAPPSRTLQPVRWGLLVLVVLALALVIAVVASSFGAVLPEGTMQAIGWLAASTAAISGGGAGAVGLRHWGAAEPSSHRTASALPAWAGQGAPGLAPEGQQIKPAWGVE